MKPWETFPQDPNSSSISSNAANTIATTPSAASEMATSDINNSISATATAEEVTSTSSDSGATQTTSPNSKATGVSNDIKQAQNDIQSSSKATASPTTASAKPSGSSSSNSNSTSSSSGSGAGLIGVSSGSCGASGAVAKTTNNNGPNGSQSWLNCGLSKSKPDSPWVSNLFDLKFFTTTEICFLTGPTTDQSRADQDNDVDGCFTDVKFYLQDLFPIR